MHFFKWIITQTHSDHPAVQELAQHIAQHVLEPQRHADALYWRGYCRDNGISHADARNIWRVFRTETRGKRSLTPYNLHMRRTIARLRGAHPSWTHKQIFKESARQWRERTSANLTVQTKQ
jgi:hypothetical protein